MTVATVPGEGRFVTTMLRPAKRPSGPQIRAVLRRLLRAIQANWPQTRILLRPDSHYCAPEVINLCRANSVIEQSSNTLCRVSYSGRAQITLAVLVKAAKASAPEDWVETFVLHSVGTDRALHETGDLWKLTF